MPWGGAVTWPLSTPALYHISFCFCSIRAGSAGSKHPMCASFKSRRSAFVHKSLLMKFCSNEYQKRPWEGQEAAITNQRRGAVQCPAPAPHPQSHFCQSWNKLSHSGSKHGLWSQNCSPSSGPYYLDNLRQMTYPFWKLSFLYRKMRTKIPRAHGVTRKIKRGIFAKWLLTQISINGR